MKSFRSKKKSTLPSVQHVERYLIGEAWMKCCSMPIISSAQTFSIPAGKSWIREPPPPNASPQHVQCRMAYAWPFFTSSSS